MTKLQIARIDANYVVRRKNSYFSKWEYIAIVGSDEYTSVNYVRNYCLHESLEKAQEIFFREKERLEARKALYAPLVVSRIIMEVKI